LSAQAFPRIILVLDLSAKTHPKMHPKSRAEKSSATPSSPGTKPRTKSLVVHFKLPKSKTEETSVEHSRPKSEAGMESLMVCLKVKPNDVGLASNLKPKVMLKLNQLQTSDLNHVITLCRHVAL
jgi:hypothetical protein